MFISTVVSRAPSKHVAAAAKAAAGGWRRGGVGGGPRARFFGVSPPVQRRDIPRQGAERGGRSPRGAHALAALALAPAALLQSGRLPRERIGVHTEARRGPGERGPGVGLVAGVASSPDDEADFEELKRAVDRMAEMSLLGGGDDMWPDDGDMMASARRTASGAWPCRANVASREVIFLV